MSSTYYQQRQSTVEEMHLPGADSFSTTQSFGSGANDAKGYHNFSQPFERATSAAEVRGEQRRSPACSITLFSSWFTHLGACIMSIASFAGLVSIAVIYGGRPLSDWPLESFSISATVAALSTVMKGALMALVSSTISQAKWTWFSNAENGKPLRDLERIDQASRGSWGSFIWLIRSPTAVSWVTVGSLLTVLGLAFDVFSQQFISIGVRSRQDLTQTAHIAWAQNVSQWNGFSWNAAIFNGIFSETIDDIPANCPTGNCTWSDLPTIGITGRCAEITNLMPSDWVQCNGGRCNYTASPYTNEFGNVRHNKLLNGPPPNSTIMGNDSSTSDTINAIFMGPAQNRILDKFGLEPTADPDSLALEVIEVPLTVPLQKKPKYLYFGEPRVTQCSFRPVIQHMTLNVSSGQLSQSVKEGSMGRVEAISTNSSTTGENVTRMVFDDTPGYYILNASQWHLLELRIGQKLTLTGGYFIYSRTSFSAPVVENWANWTEKPDTRDIWVLKFAKSLSNELRIRNSVQPIQDTRAGVAWSDQAYVQVVWPWLAHPLFMLAGVWFIFIANVVQTALQRMPVWGTSNVMLLMANIDERLRWQAQGAYGSFRRLTRKVGDYRVRLEPNDREGYQGWTFRGSYVGAVS